jgi:hypothetical protein
MRSVVAFLLTLCVKNRGRDVGDEAPGGAVVWDVEVSG